MLVPAQLYKEEIKAALVARWYDPKYQYYFSGERYEITIEDNAEHRRSFAHVDKDGNLTGFFTYNYNDASRSISGIGLISFTDNGGSLLLDVIRHVTYMLNTEAQRVEFWAFTDNPANEQYIKLIERYGGHRVAELHRTNFFNGKYHDCVVYELLVEDFRLKIKYP